MKLSILICSLKNRTEQLAKLVDKLKAQSTPDVEIISNIDNGELTVGRKRNQLVAKATGEYVSFVDDDDDVSDDYVPSILKAIESGPDCVGIIGLIKLSAGAAEFYHSIQFQGWYTASDGRYFRTPNHLNPVKRSKAIQVPFPAVNYGEDQSYSEGIKLKLKTEVMIPHPIYYYTPAIRDLQCNLLA